MYDDSYETRLEENRVDINNNPLTWREVIKKFFVDLPGLTDQINELTKEVDDLFWLPKQESLWITGSLCFFVVNRKVIFKCMI